MGEVIVVTSGKGGVGKTALCANIGHGLALLGHRVVVADVDIGLRNLDVFMGMDNRIFYNIIDVIEGGCSLKEALIEDKNCSGLYMLAAAQTRDKACVSPEQMRTLFKELAVEFDYVIVDCPPGVDHGFRLAVSAAERAIIVTVPDVASVRDADRVIALLGSMGISKCELVVNRIRPQLVAAGGMMSVDDIKELLAPEIIAVIPEDDSIMISANKGEPTAGSDTDAGKAFMDLCRRIKGENIPFSAPTVSEKKGIMARLKKLLRRDA